MKSMLKRILLVVLCVALLWSIPVSVMAEDAKDSGLSFCAFGTYLACKPYAAAPRTVEAVLKVPREMTGRAGILLGNQTTDRNAAYLTIGILEDGIPQLSYRDERGIHYDFHFTNTDVRSDSFVHLTVVHDPMRKEVRCYLNGVLSETLTLDRSEKSFSDYHAQISKNPFFIGGDGTEGNAYYFKGVLGSLAAFDDVRDADEIAEDARRGAIATAEGLLALYDMTEIAAVRDIPDLSPSGAHMICHQDWFDAEMGAYTGDYDFSLAVLGDTQNLVWREAEGQPDYRGATAALYQWIVERVESKKIQYVLGLGDIVDNDFDTEWEVAKNAITQMDGVVPYSLIRGQGHDTVTKFNRYFAGHTPFTDQLGGTFKEGSVANTWQTFSFGGTDYLIFGFDFGAPDDVLAWADGVVAEHPNHRIIVTTHVYLDRDATTLDRGEDVNATGVDDDVKYKKDPEKYVPDGRDSDAEFNDGNSIWQKFASKHENVFMVLSGHVIVEDVVINQREGIHGNTVTEILIDPQGMDDSGYRGGVGMVAMLYFDTDTNGVAIEYYSTVQKMYRKLNLVDLDHKHEFEEVSVASTCKDRGYKAMVCECGKEQSRRWLSLSRTHTWDSDLDTECNVCGKVRVVAAESDTLSSDAMEPDPFDPQESGTGLSTSEAQESAPLDSEPASDTPEAADKEDGREEAPLYAVVGIACGAGVLLCAGVTVGFLLHRRKKK